LTEWPTLRRDRSRRTKPECTYQGTSSEPPAMRRKYLLRILRCGKNPGRSGPHLSEKWLGHPAGESVRNQREYPSRPLFLSPERIGSTNAGPHLQVFRDRSEIVIRP